jgi:hypothetical protein
MAVEIKWDAEKRVKVIAAISKFIEEGELLTGEELVKLCIEEAAECMANIVDIVKPETI